MEKFRLVMIDYTEKDSYYILPIYRNNIYALSRYTPTEISVRKLYYSSFSNGEVNMVRMMPGLCPLKML